MPDFPDVLAAQAAQQLVTAIVDGLIDTAEKITNGNLINHKDNPAARAVTASPYASWATRE